MTRRAAAKMLGAALVLTLCVLVLVSLFLQRGSSSTAAPASGTDPPAASASSSSAVPNAEATATAEGGPAPSPSVSVGGDASPGTVPYSQTEEARRQWEPVVKGFGANFTRTSGRTAAAWRAALDRYVTVAVQKQLDTVDPRNVPAGRYDGFEPDTYQEEEVAAKVSYREGWALVVYVIHDGEQWRIYRYDQWEE